MSGRFDFLGIHSQPQTSRQGRKRPFLHTAIAGHVCARACARARKHGQLIYKPNVPRFVTRSEAGLISPASSLPPQLSPPASLLICAAVVTRPPPLRGGGLAPRLHRIVTLQNTDQCYHIDPFIKLGARRPAAGRVPRPARSSE